VELGKKLTESIIPLVHKPTSAAGQSSSLAGDLSYVEQWRSSGQS